MLPPSSSQKRGCASCGGALRARVALALLATVIAAGCSTMPVPLPKDCQRIVDSCAPQDHGAGPAHDCRAFAEAPSSTESACEARMSECLAACSAAPSDAGGD